MKKRVTSKTGKKDSVLQELKSYSELALKSAKSPQRALNRLSYYGAKSFGSSDYTKFVILTRARSGSNFLLSLLDSHPQVYVRGEVFKWLKNKSYKREWNCHFSKQPFFIKAAGVKIFYNHPEDIQCPQLWQDLVADTNIRIVHLIRGNTLRNFLSHKIALKNDVWYLKKSNKKVKYDPDPITLDADELMQAHIRNKEDIANSETLFKDHSIHNIFYEDLVADRYGEYARVLEFLDLPPHKPTSDEKRTLVKPLRESIENYDELKKHFQGTDLEQFFTE